MSGITWAAGRGGLPACAACRGAWRSKAVIRVTVVAVLGYWRISDGLVATRLNASSAYSTGWALWVVVGLIVFQALQSRRSWWTGAGHRAGAAAFQASTCMDSTGGTGSARMGAAGGYYGQQGAQQAGSSAVARPAAVSAAS